MTRDKHHTGIAERQFFPEFDTVTVWQLHVHEDNIGFLSINLYPRLLDITSLRYGKTLLLSNVRDKLPDIAFIIDNQQVRHRKLFLTIKILKRPCQQSPSRLR